MQEEGETQTVSFPQAYQSPTGPRQTQCSAWGRDLPPTCNLHAFYYELCDLGCRFCSQTLFRTLLAVRIQWDQMRECT